MNIVPTLYFDQIASISTTLYEHYGNVALNVETIVETTFTQLCLNVVSMSVPNGESSVATTFTKHCLNVVSMLLPNVESDVATAFIQCGLKIDPNVVLGWFKSTMTVTFKFEVSTHFQHQDASLHWHKPI